MTPLWCFSCGVISITMTRIIKVAFSWIYKLSLLFSAEVIKIWLMHQLLKYMKTFLKGLNWTFSYHMNSTELFWWMIFRSLIIMWSLVCWEIKQKLSFKEKYIIHYYYYYSLLIEVKSSWFASEKRDVRWNQILNMTVYQTLIFLVFICEYIFVICCSLFTY